MKKKMKIKDFITIGLFTAIYFVLFVMINFILGPLSPFLLLFTSGIEALLLGPIYMLFIAKTQKRGTISIFGGLMVTIWLLQTGGLWTVAAFGYPAVIIADLIAGKGKFKSSKLNILSYIFFSFWPLGLYASFWILKDQLLSMAASYGEDYVEGLRAATTPGMFVAIIVASIVLSCVGAYIGKKLLKKHFERAGIV